MFVILFENAWFSCVSKCAQAMNHGKEQPTGSVTHGPAGGMGCLLDWRSRQQGNTKICWQFKGLFSLLPGQTTWNFGVITDLRKVCPLGLSAPRLQFAHELHVVCHRFCCFPRVASSFPLFIFRVFFTARRKRTFPKARRYWSVNPQEDSGQGVHSLERDRLFRRGPAAVSRKPRGHRWVAKLGSEDSVGEVSFLLRLLCLLSKSVLAAHAMELGHLAGIS